MTQILLYKATEPKNGSVAFVFFSENPKIH